jgi:hypothetical protein
VDTIRAPATRARAAPFIICVLLVGCASSHTGEVLDPEKSGLQGTWEYLVTNGYQATFSGCSGDAEVLEGLTLVEGLSSAPICMAAVTFEVQQDGDAFQAPPYDVVCSDDDIASVTGFGQIDDLDVVGQWDSVSARGVTASQAFSGYIVGNTIALTENRWTFSGAFRGACDFAPPLTAVVTVQ